MDLVTILEIAMASSLVQVQPVSRDTNDYPPRFWIFFAARERIAGQIMDGRKCETPLPAETIQGFFILKLRPPGHKVDVQ